MAVGGFKSKLEEKLLDENISVFVCVFITRIPYTRTRVHVCVCIL